MASTVTKSDILKACEELGLKKTDTIIIHSSMKSFGYVEGGTTTVIEGFREYLSEGTLCFPALRQKDFGKAYKDWDINNTPSDVGFLSESFRKYPGVLRSDQETHSVTAIGKDAEFITSGHRGGKPRICLYGDYAFSYTSPWQRICDVGGKVLFIGVQMKYNTMKHLVESTVVTDIIDSIKDEALRSEAYEEVANCFAIPPRGATPSGRPRGFWFWYDGEKMQAHFEALGLITKAKCGDSTIMAVNAKEFVNEWYGQLRYHYEDWVKDEDLLLWLRKYNPVKNT